MNRTYFHDSPPPRTPFFRTLHRLPKPVYGLIGVVVAVACALTSALPTLIPAVRDLGADPTLAWLQLPIVFSPLWIVFFAFAAVRGFRGLGTTARRLPGMLPVGLLVGAGLGGLMAVTSSLVDGKPLAFNSAGAATSGFWLFLAGGLVGTVIQATGEEFVFRSLAAKLLGQRLSVLSVVILTSVAFALPHATDPATMALRLAETFSAGLLLVLLAVLANAIWLAVGAHVALNFTTTYVFGAQGFEIFTGTATASWARLAFALVGTVVVLVILANKRPAWWRESGPRSTAEEREKVAAA